MTFALQAVLPGAGNGGAHVTGSAQPMIAHTAGAGDVAEAGRVPVPATAPDSFGALLAGALKSEAPAPEGNGQPAESGEQGSKEDSEARDGATTRDGSEHAGAAAATGATAAADPIRSSAARHVRRDMDGLDPEFRTRLQRVIQRMEQDGHTVRINETVRSQERQEWLYAQGRSRPGPVVTWTLNSNHAQGRAADLVIDGTYNNPQGYARLAAIAAEEGLRTLGPRDAGHVELPRAGAGPAHTHDHGHTHGDAAANRTGQGSTTRGDGQPATAQATGPAGIANVAAVARVATVARPAQVARVAQVAAPGSARSGSATTAAPTTAAPTTVPTTTAAAQATAQTAAPVMAAAAVQQDGAGARAREIAAAVVDAASGSDTSDSQPRTGFLEGRAQGTATGPVARAGGLEPLDVAARVAQILDMQQSAGPRRVSSVLLRMENGGAEDKVRVDMRGSTVDARIDLSDSTMARRADGQLHELRAALLRSGLDPQSLRIHSTAQEGADQLRALLLAEEAQRPQGRSSDQPPHRRPADEPPGSHDEQAPDPKGRGDKNPEGKDTR